MAHSRIHGRDSDGSESDENDSFLKMAGRSRTSSSNSTSSPIPMSSIHSPRPLSLSSPLNSPGLGSNHLLHSRSPSPRLRQTDHCLEAGGMDAAETSEMLEDEYRRYHQAKGIKPKTKKQLEDEIEEENRLQQEAGIEAEKPIQQNAVLKLQAQPPSRLNTFLHQLSFLATGVFSTIAVQYLYYSGAASGTSMLTVFFNYVGMMMVGAVYAGQEWHGRREQRQMAAKRSHIEYDVLQMSDVGEMLETNGRIPVTDEALRKKVRQSDDTRIRNHWPIIQVAVMDVLANALVTVGFFYVGSGMYQVIYSSIVIWCALLSRIFLGRKLNKLQWMAIIGVSCGLAVSALGTAENPSPEAESQSFLQKSFGSLVTLAATFMYACVYVLSDKVLSTTKPAPIPEKVCSLVGSYASLFSLVYVLFYTVPNWQTEVTDVIAEHEGNSTIIMIVYPLVTLSSMIHSLNYYVLIKRVGSVATGVLQSLRAVLVFVLSHYMFCMMDGAQCFNEWKGISAMIVIGCVLVFSLSGTSAAAH